MPFLFTCPHCQTKTQVEDRYSGQSGACVVCGGPIKLPDFASGVAATGKARPNSLASHLKSTPGLVSAAVLLVLLISLVFVGLHYGRSGLTRLIAGRERVSSINNLQRIATALNAYAADHGTYPPPVTLDPQGVALHSWRVLILPYLGEDRLYNRLNLSLPWNAPENLDVVYSYPIPSVLRHPNANSTGMTQQSGYHLIVGPGTLFPPSGPLSPSQVSDDPALTLLVIEGVPPTTMGLWTEPVDLDFSRMRGIINGVVGVEPGGLLDGGAALATVDARGHFVKESLSPTTLRALVTPNGGELLPADAMD